MGGNEGGGGVILALHLTHCHRTLNHTHVHCLVVMPQNIESYTCALLGSHVVNDTHFILGHFSLVLYMLYNLGISNLHFIVCVISVTLKKKYTLCIVISHLWCV